VSLELIGRLNFNIGPGATSESPISETHYKVEGWLFRLWGRSLRKKEAYETEEFEKRTRKNMKEKRKPYHTLASQE